MNVDGKRKQSPLLGSHPFGTLHEGHHSKGLFKHPPEMSVFLCVAFHFIPVLTLWKLI
jgi:hypothetical protein